ncbi:MAG: hypothetical protein Q8907_11060 [Bacteroidota bacterium]|nr:hypothetical protein [Bacteroidota bacterium]MDP4227383.1 hypothetical protein [Bacteroidota bacterium]MDP4274807.1 hypothetical protein [Bacteroidota bacterium]
MKKFIFVFLSLAFLGLASIPASVKASSSKVSGITSAVVPADTCKMKCKNARCCKTKGSACKKAKTNGCCKAKK